MRKMAIAAVMLAAVSLSAGAAKKDKNTEILYGVKSGVITLAPNQNMMGGGGRGMGGFGGGMMMGGMGGQMGAMGGFQGGQMGGQMGQRPQGGQAMQGQRPQGAQNGQAMQGQRGPGAQGAQGGQAAQGQRPERGQAAAGGEVPMGRGMRGQNGDNARNFSFDPSQMETKIYFDDYGRKTVTVTKMGEERTTRTVVIDGYTYTINETENTATKMQAGANMGRGGMMGGFGGGMGGGMMTANTKTPIDWENLDAKTMKKNKITDLGEDEVAGMKCHKYQIKSTDNQGYTNLQTVCVYKNIVLSTATESEMFSTSQSAAKFEACDVPASLFQLPEGCQVTERNFGGRGGMGGGFGGGMGGGDFGGGAGGFGGGGFGGGDFGGF